MKDFFDALLGQGEAINWWQMALRAVIVFFITIFYVRIGNKRIFGKFSAFDIVLGIIFGSIMSRAITGNAPFFPALLAGLVMILLHRILGAFIYKTGPEAGAFFKGNASILVENGQILRDMMKKHNITNNDLLESVRSKGGLHVEDIDCAYLERSGNISIILKKK